ncbi:GNAT family N-acetyltransferase [Sporosarcina sp. P37]|uniref:GNAT family N-acetyltransferase n=1 Tax=unclassified Sporosarcina TaxID=2647733 RepID=UPI0009BE6293|nr:MULTISPECIES: GNAT family N-acetyltransferase [unclassified Sporosarcina]ARD48245.1 acetyltransferase [Sporosarcina sp. P33]ARK24760.1 GNAT family N-acetyltransferase [Sporosarcina sp. P37]PID19918.1 N-acetyltransferase [Sporosarcina sp. P35]
MHWYNKLKEYFPIEEMKSREHMETLLTDKGNVYYKEEGPKHVLMYVETDDFVFVDYLFVSSAARGEGLGKKLLDSLKTKNKPILLEVEPVDESEPDTEKRLKFYAREEFSHAQKIGYNRRSLATGEQTILEILYWAPPQSSKADEQEVFNAMKTTYEEIHTYKDQDFYGDSYDPTEKVLQYQAEPKQNILEPFTKVSV